MLYGLSFCLVRDIVKANENKKYNKKQKNYGRLGEEAVRIKELVAEADDRTLMLFNETYSTTSATDGCYLSMDLLRVLKELGTAVIL